MRNILSLKKFLFLTTLLSFVTGCFSTAPKDTPVKEVSPSVSPAETGEPPTEGPERSPNPSPTTSPSSQSPPLIQNPTPAAVSQLVQEKSQEQINRAQAELEGLVKNPEVLKDPSFQFFVQNGSVSSTQKNDSVLAKQAAELEEKKAAIDCILEKIKAQALSNSMLQKIEQNADSAFQQMESHKSRDIEMLRTQIAVAFLYAGAPYQPVSNVEKKQEQGIVNSLYNAFFPPAHEEWKKLVEKAKIFQTCNDSSLEKAFLRVYESPETYAKIFAKEAGLSSEFTGVTVDSSKSEIPKGNPCLYTSSLLNDLHREAALRKALIALQDDPPPGALLYSLNHQKKEAKLKTYLSDQVQHHSFSQVQAQAGIVADTQKFIEDLKTDPKPIQRIRLFYEIQLQESGREISKSQNERIISAHLAFFKAFTGKADSKEILEALVQAYDKEKSQASE